jgi:serine protease Do
MKTIQSIRSKIIPLVLGIGFIAGVSFVTLLGSGRKFSDHATAPKDSVEQLSPQGRTLLNQFSVAFESAAAKVNPSVVPIYSEQVKQVANPFASGNDEFRQFFGNDFFNHFFNNAPSQKEVIRALGSGVIVSSDGYILTNNHVVDGAQKLTVRLADKKKYTAKLIGRDAQTDVAVIKIDAKDLPVASLGNSDNAKVGEWVIAVGNPFELMHTVTAGIISAKGRSAVDLTDYEDFIQTDASINPGNSGGALADLDGNVIGINTAIYSPSGGNIGIGFAIPINMAKQVMDELISKGKVTRGFLGLVPQDIDETMAKAMKLKSTDGALVGDVTSGSPSDKGGIKVGDIITAVNDKEIKNSTELRNLIASIEPGTTVRIRLIRDGKELTLKVDLGERPSDEALAKGENGSEEPQTSKKLGITVENLTSALAKQFSIENGKGLVITKVTQGSPADDAGVKGGDVVKQVNQQDVQNVGEFNKALGHLKSGDSVALLLKRGTTSFFVGIDIP